MSAKKQTEDKETVDVEAKEAETIEETATANEVGSKAEGTKAVTKQTKYSVGTLAKSARKLFGVSFCTFAGATAGLTEEYTVKEMDDIIKAWCGKEIQ